jgi:hypothetical protein
MNSHRRLGNCCVNAARRRSDAALFLERRATGEDSTGWETRPTGEEARYRRIVARDGRNPHSWGEGKD